jgi:prepilin-type N-terminal cleavage/methylation domain-containing protein
VRSSRFRANRGFTLIEILVVVVIIGIASAVILPQLSSRDDLRAASAARSIMADLLYAQNRSIALQKMQYVQFNTGSNSYSVLDNMSPANIITHPVTQSPYTITLGTGSLSNVTIVSPTFDGQTVVAFDAMGVPYSWSSATGATALAAGSLQVKAGQNKLTVSVAPYSGEVTVQ